MFVTKQVAQQQALPWGSLAWLSRPALTKAEQLTVLEATVTSGHGHDFHCHPNQEEVIYVLEGRVEQWLEKEKRILTVGDSIFIPKGVVHASFNPFNETFRTLAILGPCDGADGYSVVEVAGQAPWNALRK